MVPLMSRFYSAKKKSLGLNQKRARLFGSTLDPVQLKLTATCYSVVVSGEKGPVMLRSSKDGVLVLVADAQDKNMFLWRDKSTCLHWSCSAKIGQYTDTMRIYGIWWVIKNYSYLSCWVATTSPPKPPTQNKCFRVLTNYLAGQWACGVFGRFGTRWASLVQRMHNSFDQKLQFGADSPRDNVETHRD